MLDDHSGFPKSFNSLFSLHQGIGSDPGILSSDGCPASYLRQPGSNSFYIVKDVCLSVWDVELGFWYYLTAADNSHEYRHYVELFNIAARSCTEEKHGLWTNCSKEAAMDEQLARVKGHFGSGPVC